MFQTRLEPTMATTQRLDGLVAHVLLEDGAQIYEPLRWWRLVCSDFLVGGGWAGRTGPKIRPEARSCPAMAMVG